MYLRATFGRTMEGLLLKPYSGKDFELWLHVQLLSCPSYFNTA